MGMGSCRFLNVLLGLSVADEALNWWGLHLASIVGVYIVGVTWLARTEARATRRSQLAAAAAVMLGVARLGAAASSLVLPGCDVTVVCVPARDHRIHCGMADLSSNLASEATAWSRRQ